MDDEDEEVVQIETSTVKKIAHMDVRVAFDTIKSYFTENKLLQENQLSINRLGYRAQTHHMHKPKKSPTMRHFFNTHKPN